MPGVLKRQRRPQRRSGQPVPYISGPYRPKKGGTYEQQRNIERARDVAVELFSLGYAPFCPHMNSANLDGCAGMTNDDWMRVCLTHLERSDFIVMIDGWEASEGAIIERETAKELGMPVYEWPRHRPHLTPIEEVS